jgi:hypothetical protein
MTSSTVPAWSMKHTAVLIKHILTANYDYEMTSIIRMVDDDNDDDKEEGEGLDESIVK